MCAREVERNRKRVKGKGKDKGKMLENGEQGQNAWCVEGDCNRKVVAVITRTKDRPLLLKRAIESVLSQTYPYWIHVIVDDSTDPDSVDSLIAGYRDQYQRRVQVIHNPSSRGIAAAANQGLISVRADYVVIHDDDDSWSPDFLRQSISALRYWQNKLPSVRGVITYCDKVIERIEGNCVITEKVEPFNHWLKPGIIPFDVVLQQNPIPPVCFLHEREVYDEIGGYNEELPVLEDWEFYIRFLAKYDIAVHPVVLAFYHNRLSPLGAYSNTAVADIAQYETYRTYLLNAWLRSEFSGEKTAPGSYINLRQHLAFITLRLDTLEQRINKLEKVKRARRALSLTRVFRLFRLFLRTANKRELLSKFFTYARHEGFRNALRRAQQCVLREGGEL